MLGLSSALGWIRFMQDSFKFSQTLGPLVLMVKTMIFDSVIPFAVIYACFFAMTLSLMLGAYKVRRRYGDHHQRWPSRPVACMRRHAYV
jgi:hypothetical protein